jgi:hypothetical protein
MMPAWCSSGWARRAISGGRLQPYRGVRQGGLVELSRGGGFSRTEEEEILGSSLWLRLPESQPVFLQNAAIHHHKDPSLACLFRSLFMNYIFLHPDRGDL